jgi:hypothetical protein
MATDIDEKNTNDREAECTSVHLPRLAGRVDHLD